ncbi:MAG: double-strand break repair protein AddB [Rhodospirillaceae bacterium]|nr:double-strand break repair protein AddB [Rhodospirillaceae bacterium]
MTPPDGASVYSIPLGESIVDALARGLLAENPDPLRLSEMLILLPNRRGCRALREAFLRHGDGRPLLLPRMMPLGEFDEEEDAITAALGEEEDGDSLPPAVPPLRRQLLLTSLILKLGAGRGGEPPSPEQAASLAAELASLLDQVQIEELDFGALASLAPEDYAAHWQITLDFLKILTEYWPAILAEQGWMDGALRRNRLIDRRAAAWARNPPPYPVVAAGSTGSMPATARLLATVARLPQGRVVLPGLDRHLDAESWESLPSSHPQYGLARLLEKIGVSRDAVLDWPDCRESPRAVLMSEALRPDGVGAAWRQRDPAARQTAVEVALNGLTRLDCPGPREEAGAIALRLREVLEHPGKRATLITADRGLGRRVAAELRRFGIEIDDSAGRSLDLTVPGSFLLLLARMVASGFAPHETLAALKHPLARGGLAEGVFQVRMHRIEIAALRGPRPGPGAAGIRAVLAESGPDNPEKQALLEEWDKIAAASADLSALMAEPRAPLASLLAAHCRLADHLAATETESGAARLWAGDAGAAASLFIDDLADAADALPPMPGRDYPGLLRTLMAGVTVRPSWGGHPRLSIWGPLEARLQHADLLILGGLNEGSWPPEPASDPWLSRPMRERFGLPSPERRIGLSAHDFEQAVMAAEVMLTRSVRVDGTPSVPSRWLLRLDAALSASGLSRPWASGRWIDWHAALDRPTAVIRPEPPAPRPPLAARPRRLSATAIERWMRDPYAIYAEFILKLWALDPIDADPAAADYGSVVHGVLDAFVKEHPKGPLPAGALDWILEQGRKAFATVQLRPGLAALWWPRFVSVARWFVDQETARRPLLSASITETRGSWDIAGPAGPFTLSATADRIDILADGSLAVIDYKTGTVPTAREIEAGFSPQLPIEAAIALKGGFSSIPARPVTELLFWRLKGGMDGGEIITASKRPPGELAAEALAGVAALVAAFDDENTPYAARPHPDMAPRYSDYGHLARILEWSAAETGGDE